MTEGEDRVHSPAAHTHRATDNQWAGLERLAKAVQVSRDAFMGLSDEKRREGRPDWWVDHRAFADAASPATVLKLIEAARASQVGMTSDARNAPNPPPKEAEPWRPELKTVVDEMVGLLAPDQGEMLTAEGRRLFGLASRAQTLLRAASPTGEDR